MRLTVLADIECCIPPCRHLHDVVFTVFSKHRVDYVAAPHGFSLFASVVSLVNFPLVRNAKYTAAVHAAKRLYLAFMAQQTEHNSPALAASYGLVLASISRLRPPLSRQALRNARPAETRVDRRKTVAVKRY